MVEIELKKLHGNKHEVPCKNKETFWMFRQSEKMKITKGKFMNVTRILVGVFFVKLYNAIQWYNSSGLEREKITLVCMPIQKLY